MDARNAYDCISRAAFLRKLRDVAPKLVPFACTFFGRPSAYQWWDDEEVRHEIRQAGGCEQADPLATALLALGQHDALRQADSQVGLGESLLAFLDDLYVLLPEPTRARAPMDLVTGTAEAHTGIAANLGKTRVFNNAGGPPPPGVAALGSEVWRGERPPQERGFVALGTRIGTPEYVRTWGRGKIRSCRSASSPFYPTSSAPGSASAFAQRHEQTTR